MTDFPLTVPALVRLAMGAAVPVQCKPAPSGAGCCAFCGVKICEGDPCVPSLQTPAGNDGFHDHFAMADRYGRYACGDCALVVTKEYLQPDTLVTPAGRTKLSSNIELMEFLLNPPRDVPFAATVCTTKQQHLYWRTPLNVSPARFSILVGPTVVEIRHAKLMRAVQAQTALLRAYSTATAGLKVKSVYASALSLPERKLKAAGNYDLFPLIAQHTTETPELIAFQQAIAPLTGGEKWALIIIGQGQAALAEQIAKAAREAKKVADQAAKVQ